MAGTARALEAAELPPKAPVAEWQPAAHSSLPRASSSRAAACRWKSRLRLPPSSTPAGREHLVRPIGASASLAGLLLTQ